MNIPAFPSKEIESRVSALQAGNIPYEKNHLGMTLRDYFASSILNGICSNQFYMTAIFEDFKLSDEKMKLKIAEICYEQADAMIKQREAKK
jgi:hypothetical protein